MSAWHTDSSCMLKDLVEQVPGQACLLFAHFLDGVAHVNQHVVAGSDRLALQHEEADRPFDALRLADSLVAVHRLDSHWHCQAHINHLPLQGLATRARLANPPPGVKSVDVPDHLRRPPGACTSTDSVNVRASVGRSAPTPTTCRASSSPRSLRIVS